MHGPRKVANSEMGILSSACGREIVWAGIRYRVTGPQKTEILNSKTNHE